MSAKLAIPNLRLLPGQHRVPVRLLGGVLDLRVLATQLYTPWRACATPRRARVILGRLEQRQRLEREALLLVVGVLRHPRPGVGRGSTRERRTDRIALPLGALGRLIEQLRTLERRLEHSREVDHDVHVRVLSECDSTLEQRTRGSAVEPPARAAPAAARRSAASAASTGSGRPRSAR